MRPLFVRGTSQVGKCRIVRPVVLGRRSKTDSITSGTRNCRPGPSSGTGRRRYRATTGVPKCRPDGKPVFLKIGSGGDGRSGWCMHLGIRALYVEAEEGNRRADSKGQQQADIEGAEGHLAHNVNRSLRRE